MAEKKIPIRYTNRDFNSIRGELINYAKRYYPEQIKDFGEASFSSFMIDSVSYIGDMLSFYLDYHVNESFLDTASEYNNLLKLGRQLGYKFKGRTSSTGLATFFVLVPANSTGLGPDTSYIPTLQRGAHFSSSTGASFTLTEDVKFSRSDNQTVVARVDETSGVPTYYAIRSSGRVISGKIVRETFSVGSFEKFLRISLSNPNSSEIIRVTDTEGHEYFEVDYLSQDAIYKDIANFASDSDTVSSILRPFAVPRRFVFEKDKDSSYIQFGYGSDSELSSPSVAEPSTVVLNQHGKTYNTDEFFDPSKLLDTDKFGVAPSDTILTVDYRVVDSFNINAPANSLKNILRATMTFDDTTTLSASEKTKVSQSLEISNSEPILGNVTIPNATELRRRIFDMFATQDRAITATDVEAFTYAMPSKYGGIKRCKVVKDSDSFKRNINLYILAEGTDGKLAKATVTLKENLKMWLNSKKAIHDTYDIIDGKIINLGIEFTAIADPDYNKTEVLSECVSLLSKAFAQPKYLGEPISITEIYKLLAGNVRGLLDIKSAKFVRKKDSRYSSTRFDLEASTSSDGRYIEAPINAAFEIKYPSFDIKGTVE